MGFSEAVKFFFSIEFYEVNTASSTTAVSQIQNNAMQMLNIGKVLLWIMTFIMVLYFLFRKPNLNEHTSVEVGKDA